MFKGMYLINAHKWLHLLDEALYFHPYKNCSSCFKNIHKIHIHFEKINRTFFINEHRAPVLFCILQTLWDLSTCHVEWGVSHKNDVVDEEQFHTTTCELSGCCAKHFKSQHGTCRSATSTWVLMWFLAWQGKTRDAACHHNFWKC